MRGTEELGGTERAGSWVSPAYWGTVVRAFNPREAEAGKSERLSGSSQFQDSRGYTVCAPSPKQNTQKARGGGTGFTGERFHDQSNGCRPDWCPCSDEQHHCGVVHGCLRS